MGWSESSLSWALLLGSGHFAAPFRPKQGQQTCLGAEGNESVGGCEVKFLHPFLESVSDSERRTTIKIPDITARLGDTSQAADC
jgi:hypothetical protein